MIVKQRIVSANQAIASAIQNNPTMTAGARGSSTDLEKVIQNSLGNLWLNASGVHIGYTGVSIWTSKTVPTVTSAWGSHDIWNQRNITNPWLSDSDPSNDNNAYYVGVFVWRGVPFLTPLPKLLGLDEGTSNFFDAVNVVGTAPNGRKVAESFTFVTLNNVSCPADQVLQSTTSGSPTCVARDNNYSCPDGQSLRSITNGVPTCSAAVPVCNQPGKALQFDGANWSCISVLSNLEIYEAQQRECYRDDGEHQVVATCPSGYGLLACGGGPGDVDEYGEYWVLRPDFPSNRCIGIVMKPRYYGPYWSCTYVSASCYKKN
jgi:hypothetical protein